VLLDPDPDPSRRDPRLPLLGLTPTTAGFAAFWLHFPLFAGCCEWKSIVFTADTICASIFSPASARLASVSAPTLDLARIECDVSFLRSHGIQALISERSAALRPNTVRFFLSPSLDPIVSSRLHALASYDNRVLIHPQFAPNGGVGIVPLPDALVPGVAIAALFAADQRLGRVIVIPCRDFVAACHSAVSPFHLHRAHITAKPGNPLGRLVVPFTGINHIDKKHCCCHVGAHCVTLS
jgi:hypothetical protein